MSRNGFCSKYEVDGQSRGDPNNIIAGTSVKIWTLFRTSLSGFYLWNLFFSGIVNDNIASAEN